MTRRVFKFVDTPQGRKPMWFVEPDDELSQIHNVGVFREFISPVDGTRIASRRDLAEHNSRNGVVQTGGDRITTQRPEPRDADIVDAIKHSVYDHTGEYW